MTQDRAAVRGVSYAEMLEAARRVLGRHVEVLSLHPTLLQDIWDDIHRIGEATQRQRQATTLLEELFARVNTVVAESIMLREPPRVALLVWTDPLMLAGYWCPDLIQPLACSIPTFSGNSYRRKGGYTAVPPPERISGPRVVAWVLSTLLCSAHAWAAITASRVRADCSAYCGGEHGN